MREDPYDHSGIFDRGADLQAPATVRAVFDVEHPLEQAGPTHTPDAPGARSSTDAIVIGLRSRSLRTPEQTGPRK
jgi:hypothetical protein